MSDRGTILITGATGFLGSAILIAALREGYRANIVVRSASKAETLQNAPAISTLNADAQCKYFVVPDLAVPGGLDEAAAGADFVIHAASPLPVQVTTPDRDEEDIIQPAVATTLTALESARKAGTVKRFVCLSSAIVFADPAVVGGTAPVDSDLVISDANVGNYWTPPYGGGLLTYGASKTAALLRSLEWMRSAQDDSDGLGFDLIYMAPVYVIGRQPLARSTENLLQTSNVMVLRSAVGTTKSDLPELSAGVHIDDVVKVHLKALDLSLVKTPLDGPRKGIELFVFGDTWNFADINSSVEKLFPEEVKSGVLPNQGHFIARPRVRIDQSRFEKVFDIKLKGRDEQIQSVVSQYLALLGKEDTPTKGE